jgi:hypothetical protein
LVNAFSIRRVSASATSADHFWNTFQHIGIAEIGRTGDALAGIAHRAASQHEIYQEILFTPIGKPFQDMMAAAPVKAIKFGDAATSQDFTALRTVLEQNGLLNAVQDAVQQVNEAERQRELRLKCRTPAGDAGCDVTQRFLFQVGRGLQPEVVFAQTVLGFELVRADPRVVGVGMAMKEDLYVSMHDFELQMRMLANLRNAYPGVRLSLPAGEINMAASGETESFHIRDSVEIAGAERIVHGDLLPQK